jgi:hypothetical protein
MDSPLVWILSFVLAAITGYFIGRLMEMASRDDA